MEKSFRGSPIGGRMKLSRSSSTLIVADASMVSATQIRALQIPANRDISRPCSPKSSTSWISAGLRTGISACWKKNSLCPGNTDDFAR